MGDDKIILNIGLDGHMDVQHKENNSTLEVLFFRECTNKVNDVVGVEVILRNDKEEVWEM